MYSLWHFERLYAKGVDDEEIDKDLKESYKERKDWFLSSLLMFIAPGFKSLADGGRFFAVGALRGVPARRGSGPSARRTSFSAAIKLFSA